MSPLFILSSKIDDLFCSSPSLCWYFTRVSPHTFIPVQPRLSTILYKFAHIFSFGCHPLNGVTRGGPPRLLVTPLRFVVNCVTDFSSWGHHSTSSTCWRSCLISSRWHSPRPRASRRPRSRTHAGSYRSSVSWGSFASSSWRGTRPGCSRSDTHYIAATRSLDCSSPSSLLAFLSSPALPSYQTLPVFSNRFHQSSPSSLFLLASFLKTVSVILFYLLLPFQSSQTFLICFTFSRS